MGMYERPTLSEYLRERLGEDRWENHRWSKPTDWAYHDLRVSDHLNRNLFDAGTRVAIVERAVSELRELRRQTGFEAIAFTGISGAILAPIVAHELGVGLIAVRKPGTECLHTLRFCEGVEGVPYLILDDHQTSGRTVRLIVAAIGPFSWCVGTYFYGTRAEA